MSRSLYQNTIAIADANGFLKALAGIQVFVYTQGTQNPVAIYSARTGAAQKSNPIITDATGLVEFFADVGEYDVRFKDSQVSPRIADRTVQWNSTSAVDERFPAGPDIVDADVASAAAIAESKLVLATDGAVGTGTRRSLGSGANQAAPGNDARFPAGADIATGDIADGAISLAKMAGGVGSRLLYARVIPSYSAGANAFITLFTQSVTHNNKPYTMICMHSVYVTGASPYGFVMRILRNGTEMSEVANDFGALNTTTPMVSIYNGAAISGAQTWEVRVDTGNNPNTWSAPGNATGLFMIFENY